MNLILNQGSMKSLKTSLFLIKKNHAFMRSMSSSNDQISLSGIFPPIITNFDANGKIHYPSMAKNFEFWNKHDFSGYVVFGSNGESCLIEVNERADHIKRVRSEFVPDSSKLIIAGVNAESTESAIHQCQLFSQNGADLLLVANPTFYKSSMTQKVLVKFYETVAANSPKPVLVYNVPAFTGIDMNADTLIEAAHLPNIAGMKDSGGDVAKLSRLVHFSPKHHQVLAGSAGFMFPAMAVGCVGCVPALGNVLPGPVIQLFKLVKAKQWEEAAKLQARLVHPNTLLTRNFSVPGLKAAMDMFGLVGGLCKPPLLSLSEEQIQSIRNAFTGSGFCPTQ